MRSKFCDVGQHEVSVLFHSRKADRLSCCKNCYRPEQSIARKEKVVTKVCIKAKHYVIPKFSDKQSKINKAYDILRKRYLKVKPFCGIHFEGCTNIATDIHHKGIGSNKRKYYNDTTTWVQTCRHCHDATHDLSAEEQYTLGLRIRT
jgi:hypothetical protein